MLLSKNVYLPHLKFGRSGCGEGGGNEAGLENLGKIMTLQYFTEKF